MGPISMDRDGGSGGAIGRMSGVGVVVFVIDTTIVVGIVVGVIVLQPA